MASAWYNHSLVLLLLSFIYLHLADGSQSNPEVVTKQGKIIGSSVAAGVDRFAGIPFAEPPLGELRFARAVLNNRPFPSGTWDGTRFRSPCIQNPLGDPRVPGDDETPPPSEDCLFLNIWRPSPIKSTAKSLTPSLPVMVWIFGGGLCGGFASNSYFNGSSLAIRHNVILVTVSYRLGALGFLPLPDFPGGGTGGMNGFNDVIVSLKWIQRNIVSFGGNPAEITLFGQSSGSYTICNLCVSPAAAGLFSKAILMSGPCIQGPPGKGWGAGLADTGSKIAKEVMESLNATSISDLRTAPAEKLQWPAAVMNDPNLAPYFSGYFPDEFILPEDAETLWKHGRINPFALVVGHVSKDGTAAFYGTAPTLGLIPPDPKETTRADYMRAQQKVWGPTIGQKVIDQYPLGSYGESPQSAFIQSDADVYVICPSMSVASYGAKSGRNVWNYEYAHFQTSSVHPKGWGCDNGVELDVVPGLHTSLTTRWATHGSGLKYVFGTTAGPDGLGPPFNMTHCPFTAKEEILSETMMAYWVSFAKTGNPNTDCISYGKPCTQWPKFDVHNGTTQLLVDGDVDGAVLGPRVGMHATDCKFWSEIFNKE